MENRLHDDQIYDALLEDENSEEEEEPEGPRIDYESDEEWQYVRRRYPGSDDSSSDDESEHTPLVENNGAEATSIAENDELETTPLTSNAQLTQTQIANGERSTFDEEADVASRADNHQEDQRPTRGRGRGRSKGRGRGQGTGRGRGQGTVGRGRGRGTGRGGRPAQPQNPRLSSAGIEWLPDPPPTAQTAARNIIRFKDGPARHVHTTDEVSAFDLFMTTEILEEILAQTNREMRRVSTEKQRPSPESFTMVELKAFLGLLILMGVERNWDVPINELWSETSSNPRYRATFQRKRFQLFLRFLRFDDKRTRVARLETDRGAAIRHVWTLFINACKSHFIPSETLTIDEQLLAFRGRCQFIQYMPNKPGKYGIKIFWLCDAKGSYAYNAKLYLGRKDENVEVGLAESVCGELAAPILNSGRNITLDNFFTSVQLAKNFLQQNTTIVGTIKKQRREVPYIMKPNLQRAKHSSEFGFHDKITMCSYVPKKNKSVVMISTTHFDKAVIPVLKNKPEIIVYYNKTKSGVDAMDQMANTYTTKRQTRRWPLTFFYNMLDIGCLNAFRIYEQQHPELNWHKKTHCRRLFLKSLAKKLIEPQMEARAQNNRLKRSTRIALEASGIKLPQDEPIEEPAIKKRKRCHLCPTAKDKKTNAYCSKCNFPTCKDHADIICKDCSE